MKPEQLIRSALVGLGLALGVAGWGCHQPAALTPAPSPPTPSWFADVTEEVGLHFVHDAGPTGTYFMPQVMGSGAALFDFDNDGRLDLYLLQNAGPGSKSTNRLFHQRPDGTFEDVSAGSGLDIDGYNMGVAIGDVNNDGRPDVLVTQYGGLRLFLNNGDGTFTDVTSQAGLDNPLWGTSACFVDYDRDGWLDLVVANYVHYVPSLPCRGVDGHPEYCPPGRFSGAVTKLFHNLGRDPTMKANGVRFEDVTLKSGLAGKPGPGLGVIGADFNGDGWPDIFVANDGEPNHLWINQHDGTFTEEAVGRGVAYNAMGQTQGNMGIAMGDVNGDGLFDLFVTHLGRETNALWVQGPRGVFQDRIAFMGLGNPGWRGTGFGTVMEDFDQDGAPDVAVVNGQITRGKPVADATLGPFWSQYAERNQLFANEGRGRFRDISPDNDAFCGRAAVSRGLAVGDVNGDGALDLLVTAVAGPARLYRNVAPHRGHWLLVRAIDPALGRDAYGAEVAVEAGGKRRVGWVNPGQSYLCSNDPRVHFGLGSAERVDAVRVLWPDGRQEVFAGRPADQVAVLRKGEGRAEK